MPDTILAVVLAIVGLAGVLGIAYAVFTSAKVQKTLELYKEENEAQGRRIKTLEDEKKTHAERILGLERENGILKNLATGQTVMEALAQELKAAGELRRSEHHQMMALLQEMKDMIQEMWQGIIRFFGQNK